MRLLTQEQLPRLHLHDHVICGLTISGGIVELRLGLDKDYERFRLCFEDVAYLEIGFVWGEIINWRIPESHPRIEALIQDVREEWDREHEMCGDPIPGDEHIPQWFCWEFYGTGALGEGDKPWMTIIAEKVEGWSLLPEGQY